MFIGKEKFLQEKDLPKDWSWEDVDGYDFTGRVMDQGGCGSCYAVATTGILESKLKIHYG